MREYKQAIIYFYSGTGNSYRVAKWFEEDCLNRGIKTEVISVNQGNLNKEKIIVPLKKQLLIISFPSHGLMPPWTVIKFLFKIPRRKGVRFLCLPTRGSFFIGPLQILGVAGLASFLPSLIVAMKGFIPRGAVSFDMPANMTSFHPPLTSPHSRRIIVRARRKFSRNMNKFFLKGSLWFTKNNLYELIWSISLLFLCPLFPVLYLLVGRLFFGQLLFADTSCISCGLCVRSCPAEALIMKGKSYKRPYWTYRCEHCLRCLNFCPESAVQAGIFWGVLLHFIMVLVSFGSFIFGKLIVLFPIFEGLRSWSTIELFDALFYYPAFVIAYFTFFLIIGSRLMNLFFSITSISRFFGRYHEPDTSLNNLTRVNKLEK
jgi:ferredoxin